VGLGKTVEAGMIMKELAARHRADRVLVVAPAGLVPQWQREMREKFDESFEQLDSSRLKEWRSTRPAGERLSVRFPKAVISLDLAKRDEHIQDIAEAPWDLVIFDEAHKVARHGRGERIALRHRLAAELAPSADSLLLLTATPHPYAFHSLCSLVNPFLFPQPERIDAEDVQSIMVRRGKRDIFKEDGSPLFPPRWVETTEVRFEYYNLANRLRDTAVGFVMVLLQKRMVSSIQAIRRSLERRLIALKHPEAAVLTHLELRELKEREADEEALPEERWQELQAKLERAQLSVDEPARQKEIRQVESLVDVAKTITVDSKAQELRKFVEGVLTEAPEEKILIFTEYTDTLDYLRDVVLSDLGPIAQIHGSMDAHHRLEQEEFFRRPEVNLMVATDAAGEGINLQFAHLMVNYELPWNPNRIEQRIGRLHRYGQEHDVRVYNLQVVNTREGQILSTLLRKMRTIEQQLGGYAPNILGIKSPEETVNLDRLSDLIMSALAEDTPVEVTCEQIEQAMEDRRRMCEQVESGLFLSLHQFDLGKAKELIAHSNRLTPSNQDIEDFVRLYFETHGGRIENTRWKGIVRLIPPQRIQDGKHVLDRYPSVTFDKEVAYEEDTRDIDFVAFGHPLLSAIIEDCTGEAGWLSGTTAVKQVSDVPGVESPGLLCQYVLRFADGADETLAEELVSLFVTYDGIVNTEAGRQLSEISQRDISTDVAVDWSCNDWIANAGELEATARATAAHIAADKFSELEERHQRQAEVCLQSLKHFETARKQSLQQMIIGYQQRLLGGEEMDIAIRRAKSDIERLERECDRRRNHIERRAHIRVDEPRLLNVAVILPTA